jgi:xylulokinase
MAEYLLGVDVGSSSVKASLMDAATGRCAGAATFPETEMAIQSPQPGFAEQDPELWRGCARSAVHAAMERAGARADEVRAIGIAYQMHGLVCVDRAGRVLRPAILWCDSRATPYGQAAFKALGEAQCAAHLLNTPGNFTSAKLAWVKEHEPEIFAKTAKIMLPGDWLAMTWTGETRTTVSGLSEGIFWDFAANAPSGPLLEYFGFDPALLPEIVPTFGVQGRLTAAAAEELGLKAGTPVAYRAGDQPNNALSLNVLEPGEIAATAGTSGVVYGVSGVPRCDPAGRVNTFAHVTHTAETPRLGVLLCINGSGSLNSWMRRLLGDLSYDEMNALAATAPVGSDGVTVLPFGNGAERMLGNRRLGAQIAGLDFNRHTRAHLCRAVQEGVAFAFRYGIEAMRESGLDPRVLRAGDANLFKSPLFCETLAGVTGSEIELYDTDGALGAARGAGFGAGFYPSLKDAFRTLERRKRIAPPAGPYAEAYADWTKQLDRSMVHTKSA